MAKKKANKYRKLLNINPEDIFNYKNATKVNLGVLYKEEQHENHKIEFSNFADCENQYNGKQDINGDY